MTSGQKVAVGGTLIVLLVGGIRVGLIYRERNAPVAVPAAANANAMADKDDLVYLRRERPSSLGDEKQLVGKMVWVSAGGQLDYYPCSRKHADYAKSVGTLLGAEPLLVQDAFEQVAPKSATFRIQGGDRQVLLAFTMPRSSDPKKLYAVPVGYREGSDYTFSSDDVFFYDDPHELYQHWGDKIWQAVDAHKVILGMSERQVGLSLGQVSKSMSSDYGNRMVVFDNLGHVMAVTFVKDQVTSFRADQGYR
jgi:hypothetical protein